MTVKVSVVVPVHNPGPAIEPCIASLIDQSMPPDEYEVIFVDDGSTDDSPARLDAVAAAQPNIRVIHIAASGAPGRPRNVGLADARGEYVHFVDADDALAPRALEWLTGMADRYGSDVVIGKYASATLERSQLLFTHSRPRCTLADTVELLSASWAPAKLFRADFLRRHAIVFPEGWRWMEDQLFLLRAYLAAQTISVFADEPCYYFLQRDDGGHLSSEDLDPESHIANLGAVFDVIEAATPPGAFRQRLLRRFYRANILSRLDRRYLEASPDLRRRMFEQCHAFVTTRVGQPIDDTFTGVHRVRARLLRTGDADTLLDFTRRLEDLELDAVVTALRWRQGRLVVHARGELVSRVDGEPLTLLVQGGRVLLDPAFTGDVGELVDAEAAGAWARVSLINPASALEWIVPAPFALVLEEAGDHPAGDHPAGDLTAGGHRRRATLVASVEIDFDRTGPAKLPLGPGRWSVAFRWGGLNISRVGPLRPAATGHAANVMPSTGGNPPRLIVPRMAGEGLTIEVGGAGLGQEDWQPEGTRVVRDGRRLEVSLPIVPARGSGTSEAAVVLRLPEGAREWPAAVGPDLGRLRLRSLARDFGRTAATVDDAMLYARLGPPLNVEVPLGRARLDGGGGLRVAGVVDTGPVSKARRRAIWLGRSAVGDLRAGLREGAIDLSLRLPQPVRRVLIDAYRAVRGRGRRPG